MFAFVQPRVAFFFFQENRYIASSVGHAVGQASGCDVDLRGFSGNPVMNTRTRIF